MIPRTKSPRRQRQRGATLLGTALVLVSLSGCATVPRDATRVAWAEYLDTLERLEDSGAPFETGSDEERAAVERFQAALSDFKSSGFRSGIRETYAEEVFFNDSLKTLRSRDEVEEHLAATANSLLAGTVEFVDLAARDGNYYFRWVMTVQSKRLAAGRSITSAGMSHVRFDAAGRVVLHQDFWDSAGGLYEHVPALGWALRRAKSRL